MHWKKWSDMTLPKSYEGMGFKDIKKFSLAMLGKQGWRLMTNPTSVCAQVLKGKYYPTGGMGFRDIKKFNLAMLGKQGWRLMTNPTSLCAQDLKGKYYPTGDFMSACRKKNSSHTWCAILTEFWNSD
jgi:hypothetical protein